MATAKKENALEDVSQVAGTQQNLSNLYSLDIYGPTHMAVEITYFIWCLWFLKGQYLQNNLRTII